MNEGRRPISWIIAKLVPLLVTYAAMNAMVTYELGLALCLLGDVTEFVTKRTRLGMLEMKQFRDDVLNHFKSPFFMRDMTTTLILREWVGRICKEAKGLRCELLGVA